MSLSPFELPVSKQFVGKVSPTQPISEDSLFGDSTWDLSSLIHLKNCSACRKTIDFDWLLPDGSRLTDPSNVVLYISTKEFFYRRLQGHPPTRPIKATTLVSEFLHLRIFVFWMISNKNYIYSQLCQHHVEVQFLNFLQGNSEEPEDNNKVRSAEQVVAILTLVQRLWDFRDFMSDSLSFNPFNGKRPCRVLGVNLSHRGENKTPVIPDEVMTVLGNEALNYVYFYSGDILNARSQVESVRKELDVRGRYEYSRGVRDNLTFCASNISLHARTALKKVCITSLPDTGKPWREPFSNLFDLYREESYLFTACYIVVAWLTGMRDSEITSMRENCLRLELSADGVIERFKITARLFKGVHDPKGREETWVTIEPVARAIEVLTQLTEHLRKRTEGEIAELFLRGERRLTANVLAGDSSRQMLLNFAKHINIPLVDGKIWKLSSRQFRRTLARWIARRPFGEVAGMIQYKHLEQATFEGYVGTDSEFRKDLQEEQLLANLDLLENLKDEVLAGSVTGPKAPELIEIFHGVAGDRRPDDEGYMLRHLARTLYVGIFNLCFYDPAFAMCQQQIPVQERKSPITSHCQPDLCANSCITKQHLGPYLVQLNEGKRLLKTPKLSNPQRIALEQENARIKQIIEPLLDKPKDN